MYYLDILTENGILGGDLDWQRYWWNSSSVFVGCNYPSPDHAIPPILAVMQVLINHCGDHEHCTSCVEDCPGLNDANANPTMTCALKVPDYAIPTAINTKPIAS